MFWTVSRLLGVSFVAMINYLTIEIFFARIFIELAHNHAITNRVWFECAWIGLCWLMYLGKVTPYLLACIFPILMKVVLLL